jgi:hypothetical protein
MSLARQGIAAVVAVAVLSLGCLVSSSASAAEPADGWLRIAHLSPNTGAVDVRVVPLNVSATVTDFDDVTYGDVSPYAAVPAGRYEVRMTPAGSAANASAVVRATVDVGARTATTVAGYGRADALKITSFADDLTTPASGHARIRLVQASTVTPLVDVSTSTGAAIAKNAAAGTATAYAQVPAGLWHLVLSGGTVTTKTDVTVASGNVATLFVLDTADGGLTMLPVIDSSSAGGEPIGGLQTGGGWLAEHAAAVARRLHPAL